MTSKNETLEMKIEIIDNLLSKTYSDGKGLDSGTRYSLEQRKAQLQAELKVAS
jgi:hypothetical protein